MTYEEALNWCEQFTDNLVAYNGDSKRRTLGLQAMEKCKKALEKQIRKKVKPRGGQYACPICGGIVGHRSETSLSGSDMCGDCGQALDWSDIE